MPKIIREVLLQRKKGGHLNLPVEKRESIG